MTQAGWTGGTYPPVHNEPPASYSWQNMSQAQIDSLRANLIESILQVIEQALTGGLIPGSAFAQINAWAAAIVNQLFDFFNGLFGLLTGGGIFTGIEGLLSQIGSALGGLSRSTPTAPTPSPHSALIRCCR